METYLHMDRDLDRLIKYTSREQVTLFIGSGFSLKAGGPRVCDVINKILEEGGEEFLFSITDKSLKNVAQKFVDYNGSRNDLIALLGNVFDFIATNLSDHVLMSKIPHFHKIFTTNYDTLIEDIYPKEDREVITNNAGCAYLNKNVTIYKMHGDITTLNDPDSIVITTDDYDKYFTCKRFELICSELKSAFIKSHVVFIGYSLEDDNVLELIKTVRDCIGKNQKQMFLIAPGLNNQKKNQLSKNHVAYIDGYAESYLRKLTSFLKDNIVNNYRHKTVSQETYDRFCLLNANLLSTVTHTPQENKIEEIHVKGGCPRNEQFSVTFKEEAIQEPNIYQLLNSTTKIPGSSIKIPAYKISPESITSFERRINDIRFTTKEDISDLWLIPAIEKSTVKLKMKSINFTESVSGYTYKDKAGIHIDVDAPIYILKITVRKVDSEKSKFVIGTEFKKEYSNNDDAIKWIKFLIEMFSQELFFINKIEVKCDQCINEAVEKYKQHQAYYETIASLEYEHNIDFVTYNSFSEENYQNALYIKSYYDGTGFDSYMPKNATLTFEFDTSKNDSFPIEQLKKNDFGMIKADTLGDINFNGKTFTIPYKITEFKNCKAKSIKHLGGSRYEITIKGIETANETWCSDTLPVQEGNVLRLGNKQ